MKRILVTYTTFAGSTAEVARVVAEELAKHNLQVQVLPAAEVTTLDNYDGVVIGGPMIMGWHRAALQFLKTHRKDLQHIPFAVFVMGMSLTRTGETTIEGVPVFVDEKLASAPLDAAHLSFRERYARVSNYVPPILKAARPAKPLRVGIFGGRLDYGRLKWWAVLFAMWIIQAPAGDKRNWTAMQSWAGEVAEVFEPSAPMNAASAQAVPFVRETA